MTRFPTRACLVYAGILVLAFSLPLLEWVRLALKEDLFSHVLLIPFIVGYLVWLDRGRLEFASVQRSPMALAPLLLGAGLATVGWIRIASGWRPPPQDYLAWMMAAFCLLLVAGGLFFLGGRNLRTLAFPVGMLVFMVPFPVALTMAIESFFQHASAEAAHLLFSLVGQTLFREGLVFRLPGISVQVAQECSGIRSSLVLFITSLLAGHLFLRSPWRRVVLVLAVIPLGILRNGFRIFTIAMLTSHVDPGVIHSPLHHRGGPIFFLLSLVPFFLLLIWMRKSEHRRFLRSGGLTAGPTAPLATDSPRDPQTPTAASP